MALNCPLIQLEEVVFHYQLDRPVLAGVNLELFPGQRLGLIGANGAGKSSLLQLIVGLLKPVSGRIIAFGQARNREADFHEVRARVGLLFQDPEDQLFSPTVLEDVAFGPLNLGRSPAQAKEIALKTLASLGLEGYQDRITYRLSGGEKRLVSLAAVLAMSPEVLLLDEPFAGLDEDSSARLLKHLQRLDQAMIIVSHQRQLLDELADEAVWLQRGRIVQASLSHLVAGRRST